MKKTILTVILGIGIGLGVFVALQERTAHQQGQTALLPQAQGASFDNEEAFILPQVASNYLPIRDYNIEEPELNVRAALLLDVQSHRVLYARNSEEQLPIASITKLMSAMVILEHLDLNQTYTVSAEDLNLDGNGPDFEQGETFVGRDLFKVMLLESSNDATSVFVTAVHRQNLDFVQLMNEKARALGMKHTVFAEAQGLNDHDTLSTASDVAILLRAASAIPEMREILTTAKADVTDVSGKVRHVVSTNQLLDVIPHIVIGKTGNTPGALGTMALEVGVNTHDDGLIAVVLGSSDRFGDMQKLISFGMRAHQWNP